MSFDLDKGYAEALTLAKTHYENFPVVSFLLPSDIKKHIAVIYWFARTADDIADEGNSDQSIRLKKLDQFQIRFESLLLKKCESNIEFSLATTIEEKKLTPKYFFDLLIAFRQDIIKTRYENFEEVLDYCRHSANPVGRLILELFNYRNEELFLLSDKICTALQITNFLQDVIPDYNKGRIYLPKDEMKSFGISENIFEVKEINPNLKQIIRYNVERTEKLFGEGKRLLKYLSGGLKIEIGWTISGGEAILNKIRSNDFDVINNRPVLSKFDFAKVFLKGILYK